MIITMKTTTAIPFSTNSIGAAMADSTSRCNRLNSRPRTTTTPTTTPMTRVQARSPVACCDAGARCAMLMPAMLAAKKTNITGKMCRSVDCAMSVTVAKARTRMPNLKLPDRLSSGNSMAAR